ncbi:uncharacterized protein EV420DRAFT_1520627 [Desarmillaria tabescens]|uniref:Secreted protein n=1 Tax=Armillaria tabescens TaxID=1929756 RepID=A0AA39T4F6_ARMTA|nr:uncharacterized protein EV420DRAFT_1520627 [Desarmillaria tabescens]KAK0463901.1 hypothetical protein EV420DRAFT_1520627 [Desarmillaria tabescens]
MCCILCFRSSASVQFLTASPILAISLEAKTAHCRVWSKHGGTKAVQWRQSGGVYTDTRQRSSDFSRPQRNRHIRTAD